MQPCPECGAELHSIERDVSLSEYLTVAIQMQFCADCILLIVKDYALREKGKKGYTGMDEIIAVFRRYRHLDALLADPAWLPHDWQGDMLYNLWLAVKTVAERETTSPDNVSA